MTIIINETEVPKNLISINTGLNFGRFDFEGMITDQYKIVLTKQELKEAIEVDFNAIRNEIKKDDELQNETSEFSAINYCSFSELLTGKSEDLYSIMTTYLDRILFNKLFSTLNNGPYIINSTDNVSLINDQIEISGRTYRKSTLT